MGDHHAGKGCACPPELDEIDLIAAADDEATDDVWAHLVMCDYCAARGEEIADLQWRLRERLYRLFCPTSDELAAFSQGKMIAEERERIAGHLDECSSCAGELALFEQVTASLPARPPGFPLRRVVAHPARLPSEWGQAWLNESLIYRAGALRLALFIERQRGAHRPRLRGILRGGRQRGLTASLLSKGRVVSSAPLNEEGEFLLEELAPGDFALSVRLPDYEVIVETLRIM